MPRRSVSGAVFAAMLACAAPALADYEAGQRAWDAGDAATALAEWRAAATAEDRRAMLALGRLYLQGVGALQDYVEAHTWFNLAASRGSMEAAAERDALAAKMTPAQVAAAQARAAAWRPDGEASTAAEGDVFRDCDVCPEMVVVPAGSFMMGALPSEKGQDDDEGPVHRVTIAEPFAVGVYEVTFEEWDACVSGGGCGGYIPSGEGWGRGSRPVINVGWNDAQAYVVWLSRKTGEAYRLLSEAEWEYAARAGTTTRYHWGDDFGRNRANCGSRCRDGFPNTAPVGSFAANGFGLHDMHGNVWEWVEDCWKGSYVGAPSDGSAWESGDCSRRVLRGGSWGSNPWALRAAFRNWGSFIFSSFNDSGYGFRVSRTLAR